MTTEHTLPFLKGDDAEAWRSAIVEDRARQHETAITMRQHQTYSADEDAAINSAYGLLEAMQMQGIAPFKDYSKGLFSDTKFASGFFNKKTGDIYATSEFTVTSEVEDAASFA